MVYRHFGGEVNVDGVAEAALALNKSVSTHMRRLNDHTRPAALRPESWLRGSSDLGAAARTIGRDRPAMIDVVILPAPRLTITATASAWRTGITTGSCPNA
jgi:hypothetical protein